METMKATKSNPSQRQGSGQTCGLSKTKQIKQALNSALISQLPDEKIRELILVLMKFVGIRPENYPDRITRSLLEGYLRKNVLLTHDEMLLAFEWAVNGTLDVNTDHFQSFDALYLQRIINAYQRKRSELLKPEMKSKDPEYSQEQSEMIMRDGLIDFYISHKKGEKKYLFSHHFFGFLERKGKMKLTKDDWPALLESAKVALINDKRLELMSVSGRDAAKRTKAIRQLIMKITEGTIEKELVIKAKELAVGKYLDKFETVEMLKQDLR
jgi:hypothetical protein